MPSATLVMERTKPWVDQGYPVIFTGDFNSQLNSDSYAILVNGLGNGFKLTNTYDIVANPRFARNNGDTFNDNFGCPRYVSLRRVRTREGLRNGKASKRTGESYESYESYARESAAPRLARLSRAALLLLSGPTSACLLASSRPTFACRVAAPFRADFRVPLGPFSPDFRVPRGCSFSARLRACRSAAPFRPDSTRPP